MTYSDRPDMDDLPHTEWRCEVCNQLNSCLDAECQFCDGPDVPPSTDGEEFGTTSSPFILSIETVAGKSYQHGFHLGTDEAIARHVAIEIYHARVANNLPVHTVAIMRDHKVIDCYDGREWFNALAAKCFPEWTEEQISELLK